MAPPVPKASIGVPVHNGGRYLRMALEAVLAQEFQDFEILISDNASTDNTEAVARELAARDARITYLRSESNRGATWNFSRTCELARGEYFAWASCHDLWAPGLLGRCVAMLDADRQAVLSYPLAAEIDAQGRRIGPLRGAVDTRGLIRAERYRCVIRAITGYPVYGLFRLAALRKVLPIRPCLGPDALLLAELSLLGSYAVVGEELFFHRRLSVSRNWRRYFGNLKLALTPQHVVGQYVGVFREYFQAIARQVADPREREHLGCYTLATHPLRTFVWFGAMLASLVFRRYYRPW